MRSLSDSQRQSEIARRTRSIQSGSILSKKKVITAHERYIRERQAHLKERIALQHAMHKLQGEAASALLKDNPSLRSTSEAVRKLMPRNARKKITYPSCPAVQPRISAGSILTILTPPYSNIWVSAPPPDSDGNANSNAGTFGSDAFGDGSWNTGYGGIAGAYFPISNSPMGHFRPYIRFNYNWQDFSVLDTAHSDGYIHAAVYDFNSSGNISVWPPAEQTVTVWQDGTTWYDSHSGGDDGLWTGLIDVAFPLTPGHAYALWMWTEVHADDGGFNFLASSFAQGMIGATCPFIAVEESQT
jgi:hypothetical protein